MHKFFVSVIVPVYNGEKYLAQAIDSIRTQNYAPLEIIIVDDGSTDGTAALCSQWRDVRYVHQTNQGTAAARNRALALALGDVMAFLDADDLWCPDALGALLTRLAQEPHVEIVRGLMQIVRLVPESLRFENFHSPRLSLNLGAMIIRKTVFDRIGGFDEAMRQSEDADWFFRAHEHGIAMAELDQLILLYRLHGENITLDRAARSSAFLGAIEKSLRRRRSSDLNVEPPPMNAKE